VTGLATRMSGVPPSKSSLAVDADWARHTAEDADRAVSAGDRAVSPTPRGSERSLAHASGWAQTSGMASFLRLRRSRRDWIAGLLVLCGLAVFVVFVYVVVVLGGGALIGQTSSPHVWLSVLATAIVALAFGPVQSRLEEFASHVVHGGKPSPYDVLTRFSKAVTGSFPAEELPARMAKVLADGTGAEWAQVWLFVERRLTLAATWPPGAAERSVGPGGADAPGLRSLPVRQAGEHLGSLIVQEREFVPLTSVEQRLFAELASQAGLVLRGARLRAELMHRVAELSTKADELRLSLERVVDAQDAARSRLERDIHDGAQQHLVALAVNLRLAHTLACRSPDRANLLLAEQEKAARETIQAIVYLSRGIYPRVLTDEGLAAALKAEIGNTAVPVELAAHRVGRYPASVEAAAYFCCLEALQNAAKHSDAVGIRVDLRGDADCLTLVVEDDGVGFDPQAVSPGAGMTNMPDRIESAGGTLIIESAPALGTRVEAHLPAVGVPAQRAR
jgi:signal transduction histidine kinase